MIYPCTIVADRYDGTYSGGEWLAFPLDAFDLPEGYDSDDITCAEFWSMYLKPVGRGATPQAAYYDLERRK